MSVKKKKKLEGAAQQQHISGGSLGSWVTLINSMTPFHPAAVVHQAAQWQQRDPAAVQGQPDRHGCDPGAAGRGGGGILGPTG